MRCIWCKRDPAWPSDYEVVPGTNGAIWILLGHCYHCGNHPTDPTVPHPTNITVTLSPEDVERVTRKLDYEIAEGIIDMSEDF